MDWFLIAPFAVTVLLVMSVVVYWLRRIDAEISAGVNTGAHLKVKRGHEEDGHA